MLAASGGIRSTTPGEDSQDRVHPDVLHKLGKQDICTCLAFYNIMVYNNM